MKINYNSRVIWFFLRYMAVLITAILLFVVCVLPAKAVSGDVGDDITWSIENGKLILEGKGNIPDYTESNMAPWFEYKEQIFSISIDGDITGIGDMAFYGLTEINYVYIPSDVSYIGKLSFASCTGLEGVEISEGLQIIGADAFNRCENLSYINLPDSLKTIENQAFYLCSKLPSVTIPANVTELGSGVFSYCESLMQAKFNCKIASLPAWTFLGCTSLKQVSFPSTLTTVGEYSFYNCEQLEKVYYDGSNSNGSLIESQIQNDLPDFIGVTMGDSSDILNSSMESTRTDEDGTIVEVDREVIENDNVSIDIRVEHTIPSGNEGDRYDFVIDSTVSNISGWEELIDYVSKEVSYAQRLEDTETTVNQVIVNVNSYYSEEISTDILKKLAGANAVLIINSANNTTWNIDCTTIEDDELSKEYNLKFTLEKNENPTKAQKELIGDVESYIIEFEDTIPFEVMVEVRLGITYAREVASFCQKTVFRDWQIMQSVMIDDYGYAQFYLGSLDSQTKYMIAIDVDGINPEDVLIPDSIADEYGGLMDAEGNKYVLTGTKSTWGISFLQLTLILVGVILGSVVIVGFIVRIIFKHQQKKAKGTSGNKEKKPERVIKKKANIENSDKPIIKRRSSEIKQNERNDK